MVGNFIKSVQGIYPFSPCISSRVLNHFQSRWFITVVRVLSSLLPYLIWGSILLPVPFYFHQIWDPGQWLALCCQSSSWNVRVWIIQSLYAKLISMNNLDFPWHGHTFAQCRDLEDNYHEKVWEIAVATLENVAKDHLEVDMPDDVKMVSVIPFRPNWISNRITLLGLQCQ